MMSPHCSATPAEQIERQVYEVVVRDLYRRHVISAGHAAEILGMDKRALVRWAGENDVPYVRTAPEDRQHELQAIRRP